MPNARPGEGGRDAVEPGPDDVGPRGGPDRRLHQQRSPDATHMQVSVWPLAVSRDDTCGIAAPGWHDDTGLAPWFMDGCDRIVPTLLNPAMGHVARLQVGDVPPRWPQLAARWLRPGDLVTYLCERRPARPLGPGACSRHRRMPSSADMTASTRSATKGSSRPILDCVTAKASQTTGPSSGSSRASAWEFRICRVASSSSIPSSISAR